MKKNLIAVPAAVLALGLTLAGCAQPPPPAGQAPSGGTSGAPSGAGGDFKACMVSDAGGFDDKSFNQTSYAGLERAKDELGIQTGQVESQAVADFAGNIQSMIDADCNMIVTVGFLLSDATLAAAQANPDVQFAIVDDNNPETFPAATNLKPLVFNTAQSSFMAGYLAAGMSKTGKIGTFGGAKIPTVTIFMDGYAQGAAYYNQQKGAQVQVLGWDAERQDGQFVPEPDPFDNIAGARSTAQNLVSQGADILFPVAGPSGLGGLEVAKSSGGNVSAIWVDTDGCVSAAEYCDVLISSVTKGMDVAVFDAIKSAQDGSFDNTPFVGTLENDGTGLAPYNQFDSKVPAELKAEIEQIKSDILSGTIVIDSQSQPQA